MALGIYNDTIVAPSTPNGSSALAIVRVSGSQAIKLVSQILGNPEQLWALRGGAAAYVDLLDTSGALLDDCLIHAYRAPKSFTGEDLVEITPHGSPAIVELVIRRLTKLGARMAEPGEFSRRAYLNGKIGIAEIEGIATRIRSTTESELRGSELAIRNKFNRLERLYDELLIVIAHIDAEIDFGESDAVLTPNVLNLMCELRSHVNDLIQDSQNRSSNLGYLTLSLVGPPNVGKSSVFNALLNYERSIVSPLAGTTRDYVEAFIEIEGVRVKLVDTAGIRATVEEVESRGIALGAEAANASDITLWVTDHLDRKPSAAQFVEFLNNKIDLDGFMNGLSVSAITGEGFPAFHVWLRGKTLELSAQFSRPVLEVSERTLLQNIVQLLSPSSSEEPILLSEQLRTAVAEISQLLGRNVSEESLDRIFSQLCIGK